MKNGNPHRKSFETQELRNKIGQKYLMGLTLMTIAKEVGINYTAVHKHLMVIRKQWQKENIANITEIMNRELTRIDQVEFQAWNGWRRSLTDKEKKTNKETDKGNEQSVSVEGQAGDPRFLEVVLKCSERRCKIFGIEKDENNINFNQYTGTLQITSINTGVPVANSENEIKELSQ